jgi:hypothetical protein
MSNIVGISLGNVCKSAIWAVNNNYRKTREQGYKTCVFDLMISNYKGIIKCILDDFNFFCDPNYLVLNNDGIFNTYYNFGFNHESPDHADLYLKEHWPEGKNHFINNNYRHFINRYTCRINNFKNYLNDCNNYIVFVIEFSYDKNPNNDCIELRNALKIKYPNLKYEIIII